ncbi:porin [Pseudoduganella namucuonensis]|uniref:Porin n=1 Tax=Pseudoduganella namucuonensis TaxID=1035707 RepID=A0A1I7KN32_9BURK|nr:porin [Pseudoduganella namucuonensis]SFU98828.1 porin [Pseudoduganella namucuonensis]
MKKHLMAASILAALGLAQAHAGALDSGNLSIGGFGTLGVAQSDADDVQFARYNQAVGVKDSPRIGLDSNLGLQATYKFNDMFSATAQVLTRKNTSPQFTTDLTWAFVKAKLSDELSVRVGRMVLPAFTISDYQNVGYANTMMRPPIEMYGQEPIENLDGADANWQHAFGDTNVTVQGFVGVSSGKLFLPTGGGLTAKYRAPAYGFAASAEHGPFTVRLGHLRAKLDSDEVVPVNSLVNVLTQSGFAQLGRDIALEEKHINFTSLGLNMDWNNVVLQTEYAQRRAQEPVYASDSDSWYVMAGYRFGKVLPYAAHAALDGKGSIVRVPAALARAPQLAAAVDNLLLGARQSTKLIGVRWDFAQSLALKVQVDRVNPKRKSGSLIFPPAAGRRDSLTVVAAGVDFVF